MKKLISVLVCMLILALAASCAYAVEEDPVKLAANSKAVQQMLDSYNFDYEVRGDNNDVITLEMNLEGDIETATCWIFVYDYGVHFQADYDTRCPSSRRDEMSAYLIRENFDLKMTSYYMDYDEGLVGSQYFLYTDEKVPEQDSLRTGFALTVGSLEDISCGVVMVLDGESAEYAYQQNPDNQ